MPVRHTKVIVHLSVWSTFTTVNLGEPEPGGRDGDYTSFGPRLRNILSRLVIVFTLLVQMFIYSEALRLIVTTNSCQQLRNPTEIIPISPSVRMCNYQDIDIIKYYYYYCG